MNDDILATVKAALAAFVPCPQCGGSGAVETISSHAEHDPGCDGACRDCPIEVSDSTLEPCGCVFAQAQITKADYDELVRWLRALVARCEQAEAVDDGLDKPI
jgi:hypothetical protein